MRLFDEVKRTALEPKGYVEGSYSFLNRSAWPSLALVRQVLEDWFSRFPESARADLAGRFTSGTDSQHLSAFFELWTHELLRSSGCNVVEAHPQIAGMKERPDFLAETGAGEPFYVEVFCSHDRFPILDSRNLKSVFEALNQLESPDFFINILSQHGAPATPPRIRELRAVLRHWLAELDHGHAQAAMESGAWHSLPTCPWSWDGWEVEFTATPKNRLRGVRGVRTIGIPGVYAGFPNSALTLGDKIGEKARRYRSLEHPLLFAVDAIDMFLHAEDLKMALFGGREDLVPDPEDKRSDLRARDALWLSREGPRNAHVSAILVGKEVLPWHPSGDFAVLAYNPWAERPISGALLPLEALREDHNVLTVREGLPAGEVLGLPQEWPRFGRDH